MKFDLTTEPKLNGCGLIWAEPEPEGDKIDHAWCRIPWPAIPHYHEHMLEIYTFKSGRARVTVGGETLEVAQGSVVEIPAMTAHFTIPYQAATPVDLVASNQPPFGSFDPPDFVELWCDNATVGFSWELWMSELKRAYSQVVGHYLVPPRPWQEYARQICHPDFREQFNQLFPLVVQPSKSWRRLGS
jgi:mannose-6-phosphate isomerase-like protein (cupin superfamily)